jgi:hypothetical protein
LFTTRIIKSCMMSSSVFYFQIISDLFNNLFSMTRHFTVSSIKRGVKLYYNIIITLKKEWVRYNCFSVVFVIDTVEKINLHTRHTVIFSRNSLIFINFHQIFIEIQYKLMNYNTILLQTVKIHGFQSFNCWLKILWT